MDEDLWREPQRPPAEAVKPGQSFWALGSREPGEAEERLAQSR